MKQLVHNRINYLSFEGGGGAGNAYPGALAALEGLGIIAYDSHRASLSPAASLDLTQTPAGTDWRLQGQIKGISGASAGAINALFMSLGYTPTEVEHILKVNDFNAFFDAITPGLIPHVGGFRREYTNYDLSGFYEQFSDTMGGTVFNALTQHGPYRAIRFSEWLTTAAGLFVGSSVVAVMTLLAEFPKAAVQQVLSNLTTGKDAASFAYDYGLFPGLEIRRFFARYISLAVERILQHDPRYHLQGTPGGTYGLGTGVDAGYGRSFRDTRTNTDVRTSEITFRHHEDIFGTKLLVTGTNLETQKSHFFSAETTPSFRVVDAVRISMSIPIAFKPMVIKDDADLKPVINPGEPVVDHYLKGVWADGGLLNNMPVAAFDEAAGGPDRTLGLIVGMEARTNIDTIFGFLKAYPLGFLMGTGNSQLSATTSDTDRIIELSTRDAATGTTIGLFDFTIDPALYASINAQSKQTVEDFFATRVK